MDFFALTPAKDIPILYLGIGCILMAVLGGFTSDFNVIISVRHFFSVLLRSLFVGMLAFFMGMSVKIPWWLKLFFAGLFGFVGIPSILLLIKRFISNVLSFFQYIDDVLKEAQTKVKKSELKVKEKHHDRDEEDKNES